MFVKTKTISEYLSEEQVHAINYMINDNIQKAIARDPNFPGMNKGQILVTNCMTLEGVEANALVSFTYQYTPDGTVIYFLPEEVAIYDNDDDEGVNYMLEHRKPKDELINPDASKIVETAVAAHSVLSFTESKLTLLLRLREEFNTVGVDYITGVAALKIIEKVFKETK